MAKFRAIGSALNKNKTKTKRFIFTEEQLYEAAACLEASPEKPLRRLALQCGLLNRLQA
jgi:hypothetical protein